MLDNPNKEEVLRRIYDSLLDMIQNIETSQAPVKSILENTMISIEEILFGEYS